MNAVEPSISKRRKVERSGLRFRDGSLPAASLEAIVADGPSGGEALLDITRREGDLLEILQVAAPDTCVAVGLQLESHREAVALGPAGAGLCTPHLLGRSQEVLDVMPDLVPHDIGGREIPLSTQLGQLAEELQVQIDRGVRGRSFR